MKRKQKKSTPIVKRPIKKKSSTRLPNKSVSSAFNFTVEPVQFIVLLVLLLVAVASWFYSRKNPISDQPIFTVVVSPTPSRYQALVGSYQTTITSTENGNRILSLDLTDAQVASFSREYVDTKSINIETGTWEIDGNTIVVSLVTDEEGTLPMPKTVEFDLNGEELQLASASQTSLGESSLTLKKKAIISQTSWKWLSTVMSNQSAFLPDKKQSFGIAFDDTSNLTISTDCNSGRTSYSVTADTLTIGPIVSTKMFCKNSDEIYFFEQLAQVRRFIIENDKLLLMLKDDSGTMTFTPVQ